MTEDEAITKMESLLNRCDLLERKDKQWGLTEEETNELVSKKIEYFKLYFRIVDDIFVNYIEPLLFDEDIINIKQEILAKTKWEGNLLFSSDDIDNFLDNVDNNEEVEELLIELQDKELTKLSQLSIRKIMLLNIFKNIEELSSIEDIKNYILMRNIIIIGLLEAHDEIKES